MRIDREAPTHRRRRLLARPILIAGALLLFAAVPIPVAAAPTLTATPNPVTIPCGKTTAEMVLAWDGIDAVLAQAGIVDLAVNGAVVKKGVPAKDSFTLTVTASQTYSAQVQITLTGQVLAGPVRISTKPAECPPPRTQTPTPKPACPDTCFKSVKVTPHGTYATFDVETLATVKIGVAVYGKPADSKGNFPPGSLLTGAAGANAAKYTLDTSGVIPANTEHFFEVIATDGNGATFKQLGSFKTLKRQVEVGFKSIYIDDDSDGGSEGDLAFTFSVNGQYKTTWAEADTGETVALLLCPEVSCALAYFVVQDASATTSLSVLGKDDDTADLPWSQNDYCLPPSGPPYFPSSGAQDDCDWNTVEAHAYHNSHKGPNEAYTVTFNMKADNSSALRFTVTVMLKVSYA